MSETVQLAFIGLLIALIPILTQVVSHFLTGRKLNHIVTLSNSNLAEMQAGRKKMEDAVIAQLPPETNPQPGPQK